MKPRTVVWIVVCSFLLGNAFGEQETHLEDGKVVARSKRQIWFYWWPEFLSIPSFVLFSQAVQGQQVEALQEMVNLATDRLLLADKVAVNKWDNQTPIEDLPREKTILEAMVSQAESSGLDTTWAQQFFRDQMEANKNVQYELHRIWKIQGGRPAGPPVDLGNEVRPQIDVINGKLIQLAKTTEMERQEGRCLLRVGIYVKKAVLNYHLDPLHLTALLRATGNICTPVSPN